MGEGVAFVSGKEWILPAYKPGSVECLPLGWSFL